VTEAAPPIRRYADYVETLGRVSPPQQDLAELSAGLGRPHEMTRMQVSRVRTHLETNFWDFAYTIGGCNIMYAPLHRPVCELMERHGKPGWKRLMVQMPRGSLKSTIFTRTGALWRVVRDSNTTIAIFNEKVERVEKWLLAIQSIVSGHPLFRTLWADLIPPGVAKGDKRTRPRDWKWSSKEMVFVRTKTGIPEATITAMSVGGASAGGHWEWHYWDDLISVEARDSKIVMQSVKDWTDTAIYLGLSPALLNAWCSCTRWAYDDVYEHLRKSHSFRLYRRAAIENGETSWPSDSNDAGLGWTTKELLREQEKNPVSFSGQMQNSPAAGDNLTFQPSWFRKCALDTLGEVEHVVHLDYDGSQSLIEEEPPRTVPVAELSKILLVDPAPSDESERKREPDARTAMVMRGIDAWGRRYTLDIWVGREEPMTEIRRMLKMLEQWGADRIGIEEVNFSKVYGPFVKYVATREFEVVPRYVGLRPGRREKSARIRAYASSAAGGWEHVLDGARAALLEEAIPYPYGATVDILDASAYDRDPGVLGRPESQFETDSRQYESHATESGRCPSTGY
jgi:hypothetical protein